MYRPNDARFGFACWWYWCGSRLWRGRIKIVSVGAQAGLVISRLVRFLLSHGYAENRISNDTAEDGIIKTDLSKSL